MPKVLPVETRLRIVELNAQGLNQQHIADELNVSRATVNKWCQRYRATGLVEELRCSGRPLSTTAEHDAMLVEAAEAQPTRSIKNLSLELETPYRTSLRRIHGGGLILRTMRQREIALSNPVKRAARLEWAENASRVWSNWTDKTVWIDEAWFESSCLQKKEGLDTACLP